MFLLLIFLLRQPQLAQVDCDGHDIQFLKNLGLILHELGQFQDYCLQVELFLEGLLDELDFLDLLGALLTGFLGETAAADFLEELGFLMESIHDPPLKGGEWAGL